MSWVIDALLGISSVTLPALAVAFPYWKASAPVGSAGMLGGPFFSTAVFLLGFGWPAAASSPLSLPALAAAKPTYAATSFASCPFTRLLGMMLPRRTWEIWLNTTPSIPLRPNPLVRAETKAASRFGPWMPLVFARASV